MKYIKTYEKTQTPEQKEIQDSLKNYVIWQSPNKHFPPTMYIIVEIINKYYHSARINILYLYDIEKDSLKTEARNPYFKEYDIIQKDIVFQSNDLQECLDILPILNTSDKYNL
jgi:hypothetical protein